jgi:hypothetical protein
VRRSRSFAATSLATRLRTFTPHDLRPDNPD